MRFSVLKPIVALACFLACPAFAAAACNAPDITLDADGLFSRKTALTMVGDGKSNSAVACSWTIADVTVASNCGIRYLRVEGFGPKPEAFTLIRVVDNVQEGVHGINGPTTQFPGVNWHKAINFNKNNLLACNPGTCPQSRYSVQLSDLVSPIVCAQNVRIAIAFRG